MPERKAPWEEVREKYERGGYTYCQLAKEYGVSASTVSAHAKGEGWIGSRRSLFKWEQDSRMRLRQAAERLLEETRRTVQQSGENGLDIKELKELAGILQTLAGVEKTLRSEKQEDTAREKTVQVVMEGEVEELCR